MANMQQVRRAVTFLLLFGLIVPAAGCASSPKSVAASASAQKTVPASPVQDRQAAYGGYDSDIFDGPTAPETSLSVGQARKLSAPGIRVPGVLRSEGQ